MSKPIEVDFSWSKKLALKTSKLYYDYDMRHSSKRYIGWLFVAMVQFGIVAALKHDSYGILFVSTFLLIYWYYGRWAIRKLLLSRFYTKNTPEQTHIHFRIDENALQTQQRTFSWEDVLKVVELEEGVLVQTSHNALFFANDAFTNEQEKNRFLQLAKKKGKL